MARTFVTILSGALLVGPIVIAWLVLRQCRMLSAADVVVISSSRLVTRTLFVVVGGAILLSVIAIAVLAVGLGALEGGHGNQGLIHDLLGVAYATAVLLSASIALGSMVYLDTLAIGLSERGIIFSGREIPWRWVGDVVSTGKCDRLRFVPAVRGYRALLVRSVHLSSVTHEMQANDVIEMVRRMKRHG